MVARFNLGLSIDIAVRKATPEKFIETYKIMKQMAFFMLLIVPIIGILVTFTSIRKGGVQDSSKTPPESILEHFIDRD